MSQVITWPLVIKQLNLRWQLSFVVFIPSVNSEIDNKKGPVKNDPATGPLPYDAWFLPWFSVGPLYILGYKLKWFIKYDKTKPS